VDPQKNPGLLERARAIWASLEIGKTLSSLIAPDPQTPANGRLSDDMRPFALFGATVVLIMVGGFGGWAATAKLAGAVIAEGTVVVDSSVKKVQHPTGGVVGQILVRDGDKVEAGQLLLRLDETITRANLQIVVGQVEELTARRARLIAERDGRDELMLTDPDAKNKVGQSESMRGEQILFESRRSARLGQKAQLREQIAQLNEQVVGLTGQQDAKSREIALIKKELEGLEVLETKNLVSTTRITASRRESARLDGERAQFIAAIAQAKGRMSEIELKVIQLDQDLRTEVSKELRETQAKLSELQERRVAAEDQLNRVDLRSPQNGIVHQLSVHTVGGVINPGEPVMLIVPEGDALVIDAKLQPQSIDSVRAGQTAYIKFPAFNQQTTPQFSGNVTRVSADLTTDPKVNVSYFVARIALSENELKRLGALKLVPGMPAEVHIQTDERTALSYLLKPLMDQIGRAFTER